MNKSVLYITIFLAGIISGQLLLGGKPKADRVITVTELTTDTLYVHRIDTVHVSRTEIKHEQIRDTVLVGYEPKISSFKTFKDFGYGNTTISGEVLGEVLKMDIVNDFKIPQVTNTITTTNTIIKKPSGLFLTAGVNQQLIPSVGVTLVKDRYLFGITNNSIQLGYRLGK